VDFMVTLPGLRNILTDNPSRFARGTDSRPCRSDLGRTVRYDGCLNKGEGWEGWLASWLASAEEAFK
jgi:hypothetical protein